MEITIKTPNEQYLLDFPIININEFNFSNRLLQSMFNKYNSAFLGSKNFSGALLNKHNNILEIEEQVHTCHEVFLRHWTTKDTSFILGAWNYTDIPEVCRRLVRAIIMIKEANNFEVLPDISIIPKKEIWLGEEKTNYLIFFDFTDCYFYISSLAKCQLLLRLMRWSLCYNNNDITIKSAIDHATSHDVEEDSEVRSNILKYEKNLLLGYNNWDLMDKININNKQLFHNCAMFSSQLKRLMNIEYYDLQLISRHPTHKPIKGLKVEKPAILRLGLLKNEKNAPDIKQNMFVINSKEAVLNSASKFKMKECFKRFKVKTAEYSIPSNIEELNTWLDGFEDKQKFIIKSEFGSRGVGLWLINSKQQAQEWFSGREMNGKKRFGNYLIERYYNYNKEYRIHISKNGCFYTNRKMLKTDAEERWYRNDSNCVWILEDNPKFEKPKNWNTIVNNCMIALNAVGLDIGACDVRVQSKDNDSPDFIICEINSAPSFGEITLTKYKNEIQKLCVDL